MKFIKPMSRIGKKPVLIPAGTDVSVEPRAVIVRKGNASLRVSLPPFVSAEVQGDPKAVLVSVAREDNVDERAQWGLARQLIQNAVLGLQKPYEKSLEFVGVGFKVALEGRTLVMDVGYSHKIMFVLPDGVLAKIDKQVLTLSSVDKYLVGETAARIRRTKPPEPYKGKGIKYVDEVIRRKAGKTAKTAA